MDVSLFCRSQSLILFLHLVEGNYKSVLAHVWWCTTQNQFHVLVKRFCRFKRPVLFGYLSKIQKQRLSNDLSNLTPDIITVVLVKLLATEWEWSRVA